jgi:hypothetical protein
MFTEKGLKRRGDLPDRLFLLLCCCRGPPRGD